MAQKTPLAIVVPIPKGEWNSTASYNLLNIVVHDGRSYICKSAGAGTEPVPAGNAQWQLIADKGESLTFDMLTQEQKDSLAASAIAAANEARDYADAVRALLDSFASSSDTEPSGALAAQVVKNTQELEELGPKIERDLKFDLSSKMSRGSLYDGKYSGNSYCIYCEEYIEVSVGATLVSSKQENGYYWKSRVACYDENKTYIGDCQNYRFDEGERVLPLKDGTKYIRIALSLFSNTDVDLKCIPSDLPEGNVYLTNIGKINRFDEIEKKLTQYDDYGRLIDDNARKISSVEYEMQYKIFNQEDEIVVPYEETDNLRVNDYIAPQNGDVLNYIPVRQGDRVIVTSSFTQTGKGYYLRSGFVKSVPKADAEVTGSKMNQVGVSLSVDIDVVSPFDGYFCTSIGKSFLVGIEFSKKYDKSIIQRLNEMPDFSVFGETVRLNGDMMFRGSLYDGKLATASDCIHCPVFFKVLNDVPARLVNKRQSDGSCWRVRIAVYDKDRNFVRNYQDYRFDEGEREILLRENEVYIRLSFSYRDATDKSKIVTRYDLEDDILSLSTLKNTFDTLREISSIRHDVDNILSGANPHIVKLTSLLDFSSRQVYSITKGQGSACYDGRIFVFRTGDSKVYIHNAEDGSLIKTADVPGANSGDHNNTASFGYKYNTSDRFPLLYLSTMNGKDPRNIKVYRISGGDEDYSLSLVQTITFATTKDAVNLDAVVGNNGELVLYGFVGSSGNNYDNDHIFKFYLFDLPQVSAGDTTIDINDAKKSVCLYDVPTNQGSLIHNGIMYIALGMFTNNRMFALNLSTFNFQTEINLYEDVTKGDEPEDVWVHNNRLHIACSSGNVYVIDK